MAESKVNLGAGFRQKFRENNPRPSYDSGYETPSSDFRLGDIAYTAASLGAGFAPGAGVADLFGQMPDPYNPGQMSPSFSENIERGAYIDAALQTLGGAGDALYMLGATAPIGAALKGAQALGKTLRGGVIPNPKTTTPQVFFPDLGEKSHVTLQPDVKNDAVSISYIGADKPGQGQGGEMLRRVTEQADATGTRLTLYPDARGEGGLDQDELIRFYQRHGFRFQYPDPDNPDPFLDMIREPRPAARAPTRLQPDVPVYPKPQRKWEDLRPGGDYVNPGTNEVLTGRSPSSGRISVDPSGRASFLVSGDNLESVGDPKGALVKTNLFKRSAGWRPNNEAVDLPTLVSVEHRGKHYYTTDVDFTKGVNLSKYPNQRDEPRLRPTVKGNLDFGEEIGTISVRGREHPVYGKIEVKANGGVVGDYTFSPEDLYGLADTEFVVDLIGSGGDTASNLAQRGLREIQLRSPEGGLSSLIRNLGGDATVEELPLYIAGVPSAGVYNPNTFPVPVREGSSKTAYEGSRGPVNIPSRGIIVGQDAEKGVIRHELEHAGIKSITDPLDVGMSPVESAPLSILSEVIRERSIKDRSPYTSNPEHFLIESMQASEQIRSGENLPEEYKEERESFYPIGRYLNNPTPENRDIVLRVLDDILTMPAKDYNKAPYGEQVILGARQDMLHFLRMDQRKRGVPEEYLFTAEEITPEMLLENLEKSIENFNAPVERGYSTKVFESGGEVGGSAVDLGQGSPLPSEQLSFGVGDYAIMPKVFAQGDIGKQSRNPFVETSEDEAFGKLGIEVLTPEGRRFGIGREANYLEGKMDFSDEARFFGAPESLKYGTDGVEYGNISGYYESPEGYRVEGSYNPDTDDYRVYGSRTIKFDEGGIVTVPVSRDPRPTDQRNEAFGAKLLKLAGLATTPRQLANRVDPKLYEQLDVVLGRRPGERSFKSPEGGIVSMKQY